MFTINDVYIIERTLHGVLKLKIWILSSRGENNILRTSAMKTIFYSLAALVRKILFSPLESKIHIFAPPCNILYIYSPCYSRLITVSNILNETIPKIGTNFDIFVSKIHIVIIRYKTYNKLHYKNIYYTVNLHSYISFTIFIYIY
jgi:hypothetical protein